MSKNEFTSPKRQRALADASDRSRINVSIAACSCSCDSSLREMWQRELARAAEDRAVQTFQQLSATITRDETRPGKPVVTVWFCNPKLTDEEWERIREPERSQSEHLKPGLDSHAPSVAPYAESLRNRSRHGFRDRPATATRQLPVAPLALT
jgi:hypothetical protein